MMVNATSFWSNVGPENRLHRQCSLSIVEEFLIEGVVHNPSNIVTYSI